MPLKVALLLDCHLKGATCAGPMMALPVTYRAQIPLKSASKVTFAAYYIKLIQ